MSNFFKNNIILLRKKKGLTQSNAATSIGLKRNTYANYESGHTEPSIDLILQIASFFGIDATTLLEVDLSNAHLIEKKESAKIAQKAHLNAHPSAHLIEEPSTIYGSKNANAYFGIPRIITADTSGYENITHVPIKARAGYLLGYGDADFIESLPSYNLPFLRGGTFRSFEVEGHSMKPTILHKDYVVGMWVEGIKDIRENRVHIVITKNDGILIKRVLNRIETRGKLYLKSDSITNKSDYPTIEIDPSEISEIWYSRLRFTPDFSEPSEIYTRFHDMELDLLDIKKHLGFIK